jgi:hypothetical protein
LDFPAHPRMQKPQTSPACSPATQASPLSLALSPTNTRHTGFEDMHCILVRLARREPMPLSAVIG